MILITKLTDSTIEVLAPYNYTIKQPKDEVYIVHKTTRDGLIGSLHEIEGNFKDLKVLTLTTGDGNDYTFKL